MFSAQGAYEPCDASDGKWRRMTRLKEELAKRKFARRTIKSLKGYLAVFHRSRTSDAKATSGRRSCERGGQRTGESTGGVVGREQARVECYMAAGRSTVWS